MKIVTASNGQKKFSITRKEWEDVGDKAGWLDEFRARGRAKKEKVGVPDVNPKELEKGKKVEQEHTRGGKEGKLPERETVEKKITLDHLAECPDYYTRLDNMENECKAKKKDIKGITPKQ